MTATTSVGQNAEKTWHIHGCEGACLACLIEDLVKKNFGTHGLEFLRARIQGIHTENERILTKLMESMNYGADENLWPSGVDFVSAACKIIENAAAIDSIPQTPDAIRIFLGSHMGGVSFGQEGGEPHEDDTYTLTAHDLASAFRDWFDLD